MFIIEAEMSPYIRFFYFNKMKKPFVASLLNSMLFLVLGRYYLFYAILDMTKEYVTCFSIPACREWRVRNEGPDDVGRSAGDLSLILSSLS